jgi:hypothetical protein
MRHVASGIQIVETCRLWNVRPAEHREREAVSSSVPALLLAGSYDPVTPPAYAQSAGSHLPNSQLFVFPAMGHQLTANTVSTCPQTVVLQFLDNPRQRPEAVCLGDRTTPWKLN